MRLRLVGLLVDGLNDGGVRLRARAVDLDGLGAEAESTVECLLFSGGKRRKRDGAMRS